MVVSRGPRQGFDNVKFPAKMRKKDNRVLLANSSLMIKSVEFSISLRESECNSVCWNVHTSLLVLVDLFIVLVQLLEGSL